RQNLNDEYERGCNSADAVERGAPAPAGILASPPVNYHSRLRQREADEHADGIERNERARIPVKQPDEDHRQYGECNDAVRKSKTVTASGKLSRHVSVARKNARQSREIGERRIGR